MIKSTAVPNSEIVVRSRDSATQSTDVVSRNKRDIQYRIKPRNNANILIINITNERIN